ncbi:hypothetical protein STCU_11857 [Strigomonas culicis]|uniref:Uncharacterized protein n=1 Tax=Strigomonas culicis TaxID=28005 RepID=S9TH56_9TRYP|nr:hypothetical protein STCU_11857 [Strigomonas culicis]|eukprot:EPY15658.1 hypothetical protein STCU_11857 [Strigomonas culicis]
MFNTKDEENHRMTVSTRAPSTAQLICSQDLDVNMFRCNFSSSNTATDRNNHFVFVTSIPFSMDKLKPETHDTVSTRAKGGAASRGDRAFAHLPTSGYSTHLLVIELARTMAEYIHPFYEKYTSAFLSAVQ